MFIISPIIIYMLITVYYFLFKLNFWNFYGLKFGKRTNIIEMYYTSNMFAYFTFPLVINIYNIFLNDSETSF